MAKKKKNSLDLSLILKVVVLALAVVAFCMAFVVSTKFVTSKGDLIKEFTGFQTMFGYTEKTRLADLNYLGFSFMATLTFVLPLVGAVLTMLKNKIAKYIGVALMLVGAVLMFFIPSFAVLATVDGELTYAALSLDKATRTLGVGAILGGVFSGLAGLLAGYLALKK